MMNQTRAAIHIPPIVELTTFKDQEKLHEIFKKFREETPIRYDESRKCWDVFQYDDCVSIIKNNKVFSSKFNRTGDTNESIITVDPPRHTEFRKMINKVFTPKAIQNLAPNIQEITNQLIDQVAEQGFMEIIRDLASPLPCIVIAELLGVPKEDHMKFKSWSNALIVGVEDDTEETYEKVTQANREARQQLIDYLQELLNLRKKNPKDDLITLLWQTNLEKKVLSEREVVGFLMTLLVAGHETTTSLISGGIRALIAKPELQDYLRQNQQEVPSFVEETLRYYPSSTVMNRLCVQDIEFQGHLIKAGDLVNTWTISANRDENKFENAQEFQFNRNPNPHISFGTGIHFCLGAPLARLEGQVVFSTLTKRLTKVREAQGEEVIYKTYPRMNAVDKYTITFEERLL
ncbi:cytochrome P450 [Bacillus cereus]|nr:cytochrome P450 [Bacillus cereus]